jgi:tetratricopeptide (TPR) repeat protein
MFAYTDEAARETRGTWSIVPASRLLVEKYIPSKPIKGLDGASYDATMRVAFIVVVEEGKVIACKPFAPYWKLAASSIGKGSLRDGTVSSFTTRAAQVRISSMPVSRADEKIVFTQLEAVLPGMMLHLSKLDFHQKFIDYPEKTISDRAYKASQYVAIAEDFARRGSYLAAKFHLKCATELTDYKPALDIFIANIHLLSGEYEASIQMLEKILKRVPADPQSHYLLGIIFKKQNKLEEAKQKFSEVTKMPNSYYARQAARELEDLALLAKIDRYPELEKLFNSVDRDIYQFLDILDQQRVSVGFAPLQPKFY